MRDGSRSRPTKPQGPAKKHEKKPAGPAPRGASQPRPPAGAEAKGKPTRERAPAPAPVTQPPRPGDWLLTCREGYETDLIEELRARRVDDGAALGGPGLVLARAVPAPLHGYVPLAFARQGFAVESVCRAGSLAALETQVAEALRAVAPAEGPWALHVWVPDTDAGNRLARSAEVLARALPLRLGMLDARLVDRCVPSAQSLREKSGWLLQVCLLGPSEAAVGAVKSEEALSLHPGGRARMRVDAEAPSRAAAKFEEALDWLGVEPEASDEVVDLGAAPGGWTYGALARGARVIAVDPGEMAPALAARKELTHVRGSAFDFEPRRAVDWLLCDMVWRPLEVAALLARWARRGHARVLVANLKLPMRDKVGFVKRLSGILEEGGWSQLRVRQLYHDREEVTLTALCLRAGRSAERAGRPTRR